MIKLVNHIADSDLGPVLYAWTSMHELCIAQTPTSEAQFGPYVKFKPKAESEIELSLVNTYITERQWRRVAHASEVIPRYEALLDQLRWRTVPCQPRALTPPSS